MLAACAKEEAPAPATPAPAKPTVTVLKFSHQNPPDSAIHKEPYETFMSNVETMTGGRIEFEYYPAKQLVEAKADLQGARSGVADIQICVAAYNPDAYQMVNLFTLPGRAASHSASETIWSVLEHKEKYLDPEIAQLGDVILVGFYATGSYMLFTTDKPVNNIADMKGLKIRSSGAVMSAVLSKIGAEPVTMASSAMYESLQKKTLDAAAHTYGVLSGVFNMWELGDPGYIIDAGGFGNSINVNLMNKDSYDRLTPDIQAILRDQMKWMGLKISHNYDIMDSGGLEVLKDKGITSIVFDDSEKAKLREEVYKVWEELGAEMDAKGFAASELLSKLK